MPDFENAPQPYYPPTVAVPTQKTEAELRRDAANAIPGEDSIFRNDKEEQRNDPHYKQWMKDEGVDAAPVDEAENMAAMDAFEREQAALAREEKPTYNDWQEYRAGETFLSEEDEEAARRKFFGESEQERDEEQIDPTLSADLAAAAQQLRKTQEQLSQETQNEADQDDEKDLGERSKESIAVRLTEEQTKLLLSSEYPNDGRTQTTALAAIYSGEDQVNIMDESVQLDYSENEQTFFAILERGEKPALDAKLTQLQNERMRDNADREKAQDPRQRERSRERQHER